MERCSGTTYAIAFALRCRPLTDSALAHTGIEAENREAKIEIERARITGLARQACSGLDRVFGLKVCVVTVINTPLLEC